MINDKGRPLYLTDFDTGEIVQTVQNGEDFCVKSVGRVLRDKFISENTKYNVGKGFIKTMDLEIKILRELTKFPQCYVALSYLKYYTVYNVNVVVKNNKRYKCIDLAKDMGVSRQQASNYIRRLKELNVLSEIKTKDMGMLYVINPNFYQRGEFVPNNVIALFDKK